MNLYGATTFPSGFGPSNWTSYNDLGTSTVTTTSLVISGPRGNRSSILSSSDAIYYNGIIAQDIIIGFDWSLDTKNTLYAGAVFQVYNSNNTLVSSTVLDYGIYGGSYDSGTFYSPIPQGGHFAYVLDSMIYKGSGAEFRVCNFVVIPETGVWLAGVPILLFGAFRFFTF